MKKISKKNLKDWTKWNRKMGGRSFNITSGAFGDTLQYRVPQSLVLGQNRLSQVVVKEQYRVPPSVVLEQYRVPPAVVLDQ